MGVVGVGVGVAVTVGVGDGLAVGDWDGAGVAEPEGEALALGEAVGVAPAALAVIGWLSKTVAKTSETEIPSARTMFVELELFSRLCLTTSSSLTF